MTEPGDIETAAGDDAPDVSAPGSDERRAYLAAAVADVEAGVEAETFDTDGENTQE